MSDDKVDLFWPALVATISPVPGAHRQILALLHDMAFATIIYEGSSAGSGFIDAVSAPTGPETWKQTFPSLRALLGRVLLTVLSRMLMQPHSRSSQ